MFEDFLFRAFVAGIGLALIAGPLGCFIVWRRLSYFGDTLAHSALLGVVIGYALNLNFIISVFVISALISLSLLYLQKRTTLPNDALLGLLAHSVLSIGLVLLGILSFIRIDLMSLLFGDILAVGWRDIIFIWIGVAVILGIVLWRWSNWITATLGDDLAASVGVNAKHESFYLAVLLAIVVGLALKIVGALLITALLIIPAATARRFTSTPEMMAVLSVGFGSAASAIGLWAAYVFDWPAGPSMVATAAAFCGISQLRNTV